MAVKKRVRRALKRSALQPLRKTYIWKTAHEAQRKAHKVNETLKPIKTVAKSLVKLGASILKTQRTTKPVVVEKKAAEANPLVKVKRSKFGTIKLGTVIKMRYKTFKHDPSPAVLYLATIEAPNGNKLLTGFNLNYIPTFTGQTKVINLVRSFTHPKQAYDAVLFYHPKLVKSYRVYTESNIFSARLVDTKTGKLTKIEMAGK